MRLLFVLCGLLVFEAYSFAADTIEFPEEELARESVLPVFDQPEAVKKRLVPVTRRIEAGAFIGALLNDPFFNSYPIGASLHYHLSEIHSFGVSAAFVMSEKTGYVGQIRRLGNGDSIPFEDAPSQKFYVLGQYEFTPYYGKVSVTKQRVMNLMLSFAGGVGSINTGDDTGLLISAGMNQKLFLTNQFGIKADLQAMFYRQKDVVPSVIVDKNVVAFTFQIGAVYLFDRL